MREHKYRGIRLDSGEFVYGFLAGFVNDGKVACISRDNPTTGCHVRPETVGQFTGLHDSEGKEIYEGDIVVSGGDGRNFKIAQHKSSYCLYVAKGNHVGWLDEQPLDEIKVIGNIHEHSDLLKGEQQ